MNETTDTATSTARPVDLEALRLQLEEEGRFYYNNVHSKEARDQLLHTLRTNNCREIITATVDGNDLSRVFVLAGGRNHVDVLEVFLDHGMNVDIKNEEDYTALMHASSNGHEECVQFLLDHGISVDVQHKTGCTPLIFASQRGFIKIVEMLLEKNANADIQNKSGTTALMHATMRGNKEIVQVLLDHGPDIDLRSKNGKTALDLAINEEVKEMIRNYVTTSYVLK